MPKIQYQSHRFSTATQSIIAAVNGIIEDYTAQGFILTLRQIYYQLVAHDLFPDDRRWRWTGGKWVQDENGTKNAEPNYKWLGTIVNDGRMAGLIDWEAIEDRGRNLCHATTWRGPSQIISACASQHKIDLWERQPYHVEVWIEKEALIGVVAPVCEELRLNHFACKGYVSQSEMWSAGSVRLRRAVDADKKVVILHFGDHDPSGLDMTRDIESRLTLFCGEPIRVCRLALNMDQIEQYKPPPNPAKATDARFQIYAASYGDESWELDALDPKVLAKLITDQTSILVDHKRWTHDLEREAAQQRTLEALSQRCEEVAEYLGE